MRAIINISLPKELSVAVDAAVKRGKFATKSEFFRALIKFWEEEQLFRDVQESMRDFRAGRSRKLKSLADLD